MSCNRIPFVVTYRPTQCTIASTIHKYLPILHTSSRCKEAIPEPLMVAFCRPISIKYLAVRSTLKALSTEATNKGFSPFKQCTACKHKPEDHRNMLCCLYILILSPSQKSLTFRHVGL